MVSHPFLTAAWEEGTGKRRLSTLTVGRLSKFPFGEYSILIRPSPSTSKRAAPAETVAPRAATAAAKSMGVARLTGESGDVAAGEAAGPADAAPAQTIGTARASIPIPAAATRRL